MIASLKSFWVKLWSIEVEHKSIAKHKVPDYIIWSVCNFNKWFCHPANGATYAHAGIFTRIDKLDIDHVAEYIDHCYGNLPVDYAQADEFLTKIKADWRHKVRDTHPTKEGKKYIASVDSYKEDAPVPPGTDDFFVEPGWYSYFDGRLQEKINREPKRYIALVWERFNM